MCIRNSWATGAWRRSVARHCQAGETAEGHLLLLLFESVNHMGPLCRLERTRERKIIIMILRGEAKRGDGDDDDNNDDDDDDVDDNNDDISKLRGETTGQQSEPSPV
jgi:hypothetical protein